MALQEMNSHQRRKAARAGTHYRCDVCNGWRRMPYYGMTGCAVCWHVRKDGIR